LMCVTHVNDMETLEVCDTCKRYGDP